MMYRISCLLLILANFTISADTKDAENRSKSQILGMSVTGNKESPRSLTIIPWRDPLMDGKDAEIVPVWRPQLKLIDPDAYKRDVKLFLKQRNNAINTK